uniref:OSJNBb0012E24.13 protein n=1 Tax=Oryza sativa subsp. japonica TaxID=39947 RepID=Q7XU01_ORYSJ|nr:OSJNBb0012E24.13 [Oryza sativa Japonica Group]
MAEGEEKRGTGGRGDKKEKVPLGFRFEPKEELVEHPSPQPGPQAIASIASSDGEFSSPQPGPAMGTSEEASGNKRPAEEHAAVAQRPHQQRKLTMGGAPPPPPASYIGGAGGMQMPLRTAVHDNRAGHPMARPAGHATAPPPRQHATVNGPMRMPNGQVVYGDQMMMRRQMATAANNRRQMMFLQQLAARNGQQGMVVADNGQASSSQRPPPACNGQQALVVQGSQVASNGQMSPVQRQRAAMAAAYNNYQYHQMLLQQQQQQQAAMAYNLQAQHLQGREVVAHTTSAQQPQAMMPAQGAEVEQNGETKSSAQRAPAACNCPAHVQRPQARPFNNVPPTPLRPRPATAAPTNSGNSFDRTLVMRRPPSPSVVQPRPAQETPEMHARRVLWQLVKELFRQRRIDQAQAAAAAEQERLMMTPPAQAPQQPCSDAVRCNDDGEKRSAEVATTEVAPDGSASAEGNDRQLVAKIEVGMEVEAAAAVMVKGTDPVAAVLDGDFKDNNGCHHHDGGGGCGGHDGRA